MGKIADHVKPGVVTGSDLQFIFKVAQENNFAIPAVNVVGSSSVNAVMEAAVKANAPVMIQFSNGGAAFNAGKGLKMEGQQAAIVITSYSIHYTKLYEITNCIISLLIFSFNCNFHNT